TVAAKSAGSVPTSRRRASTPPAEAPTTMTSWPWASALSAGGSGVVTHSLRIARVPVSPVSRRPAVRDVILLSFPERTGTGARSALPLGVAPGGAARRALAARVEHRPLQPGHGSAAGRARWWAPSAVPTGRHGRRVGRGAVRVGEAGVVRRAPALSPRTA